MLDLRASFALIAEHEERLARPLLAFLDNHLRVHLIEALTELL